MEGRRRKRTLAILRGHRCGEGALDEPRMVRCADAARGHEAEGRADRLAGKRAEAALAEIAITARCFRSLAHMSLRSGDPGCATTAILGSFPWEASVAAHENCRISASFQTAESWAFLAFSGQRCQGSQRLGKTLHSDHPNASGIAPGDGRVLPSRHEEHFRVSGPDAEDLLSDAADRRHCAVEVHLPGRGDVVAAVDVPAELLHHLEGEREPGRGTSDADRRRPTEDLR